MNLVDRRSDENSFCDSKALLAEALGKQNYIHQETIYYAPSSDLLSNQSREKSNTSDVIKVKDYFKQDDAEVSESEISMHNKSCRYQEEIICNLQESPESSVRQHASFVELEGSKYASNEVSESVLKPTDELALSKTEQISNFEEVEYDTYQSDYWATNLLRVNWKKVSFNQEVEVFSYPMFSETGDSEPIKALHYIGFQKGLAWLKAWQNTKSLINQNEDIKNSLTLSKLDAILEREYSFEVEAEKHKEEKEDDMKAIDDAIEELKNQNELLKLDIAFLGAKQ